MITHWFQPTSLFIIALISACAGILLYALIRQQMTPLFRLKILFGIIVAIIGIIALLPSAQIVFTGNTLIIKDVNGELMPVLSVMPKELFTGITSISNGFDIRSGLDTSPPVGSYRPITRSIHIAKGNEHPDVVYHELAHNIYYVLLNTTQRQQWRDIHFSSPAPTEYGKTNPSEDFADSFELGAYSPDLLDADRLRFMQDVAAQIDVQKYGLFAQPQTQ